MNTPRMKEAWAESSRTVDGFYSSATPMSKYAFNCYDEGCNLERELAAVTKERDEARAEMIRWMSIAEGRGRTDDEPDTQAELDEARGQRDRLAEAMQTQRRVMEWKEQSDQGMRLRCGELTAQEIRTIRAVLNAILPNSQDH